LDEIRDLNQHIIVLEQNIAQKQQEIIIFQNEIAGLREEVEERDVCNKDIMTEMTLLKNAEEQIGKITCS